VDQRSSARSRDGLDQPTGCTWIHYLICINIKPEKREKHKREKPEKREKPKCVTVRGVRILKILLKKHKWK
jgi:hypothetical protein